MRIWFTYARVCYYWEKCVDLSPWHLNVATSTFEFFSNNSYLNKNSIWLHHIKTLWRVGYQVTLPFGFTQPTDSTLLNVGHTIPRKKHGVRHFGIMNMGNFLSYWKFSRLKKIYRKGFENKSIKAWSCRDFWPFSTPKIVYMSKSRGGICRRQKICQTNYKMPHQKFSDKFQVNMSLN